MRELRLLTLPEAVRRMTGFNAERMNLRDRGRIANGLAADLVVFDPMTVADRWDQAPDRHRDRGAQRRRWWSTNGRFDRDSRAGQVLRGG